MAANVIAIVKIATQYGQPRSGGHSYALYSLRGTSGSLVINLAVTDKVIVNQKKWSKASAQQHMVCVCRFA
jgi:FAD/FMN-containing dehydrogenase